MKRIASVLVVFLLTQTLYPQGAFLEKGQSGFGLGPVFYSSKDVSSFGGNLGYSFIGIFDIGVTIERFSFSQQLMYEDLGATTFSPGIAFYPLKPDEKIPASIKISAELIYEAYSNDVLKRKRVSMSGRGFIFGGTLMSYIIPSQFVSIQPSISLSIETAKLTLEDSYGNSTSETDDITFISVGMGFSFKTSENILITFSPAVSFKKQNTAFIGGLKFIFIKPNIL